MEKNRAIQIPMFVGASKDGIPTTTEVEEELEIAVTPELYQRLLDAICQKDGRGWEEILIDFRNEDRFSKDHPWS